MIRSRWLPIVLASSLFAATEAVRSAQDVSAPNANPNQNQNQNQKAATKSQTDRGVGRTYQIPYRLTNTNHYLVRVRLNGKGPFNFLVDTGAPALFIGTETAKKMGLKPAEDSFWTDVERLDFEGGAFLLKQKARVEDPFQLVGMNAMGLPGASIDGILGFSALAPFRMVMDPAKDRMTWTRLDYDPKVPFVPKDQANQAPAEVQAMSMLGPMMKVMSVVIGKQPEEKRVGRGYLGVEVSDEMKVKAVWPESPAAKGGLKAGDQIVKIQGRYAKTVARGLEIVSKVKPGDKVVFDVKRDGENKPNPDQTTIELTLTAEEGL